MKERSVFYRLLWFYLLGAVYCQDNNTRKEEVCSKAINDCIDGRYDQYLPNIYTHKLLNVALSETMEYMNDSVIHVCDIYNACQYLGTENGAVVCQYLKWCESNRTHVIPDKNIDSIPVDIVELSQLILDDLNTVCPYNLIVDETLH